MGLKTNKNLQTEVENLIRDAYNLVPEIIEATKPSDLSAKQARVNWWDRHRLHVLLDIAEETREKLSRNIAVAPWFIAEFKATLEIIKRWNDNPKWKDIVPSLKDKNHFTHTLGKLRIAEHLKKGDHNVEIVPRGKDASPDLKVQAIGGTQDWLYIECYQPTSLMGEPKELSENVLDKIIERSMDKSKRQFKKRYPGIMAVFGYNQSKTNFERLRQKISDRLDITDRPYLAGILLLNQSVLFIRTNKEISFTPILSVEYISNPSYFGRIDIISEIPNDEPTLIKEPLKSIPSDLLLEKKIDDLSKMNLVKPILQRLPRKIREIPLSIIKKPDPLSRVIIKIQNDEIFPPFKGHGNINYLCGNCNTVLAEHVWDLSLSSIVVMCPTCKSFNDFPKIEQLRYSVKGSIGMNKGTYNFSKWVEIKQGVTLFGI